jgi:hypothetical protein
VSSFVRDSFSIEHWQLNHVDYASECWQIDGRNFSEVNNTLTIEHIHQENEGYNGVRFMDGI